MFILRISSVHVFIDMNYRFSFFTDKKLTLLEDGPPSSHSFFDFHLACSQTFVCVALCFFLTHFDPFFVGAYALSIIIDSAMELALSLEKLTNEKLLLLHSVRFLYSIVWSTSFESVA